jgi:hypothetical protein
MLLLVLTLCMGASCKTETVVAKHPACAFSDPVFMTHLRICYLAADYYITHQRWPDSVEQLANQNQKLLFEEQEHLSPEDMKEGSRFLERFTTIKLKKRGDNLVLHYQFEIEGQKKSQTVIMRPGMSADEILTSAARGGR